MRLLRCTVAVALLTACALGCSKEASYKPANAPAVDDEKPLNARPMGEKTKSRKPAGLREGN
jgi:hypothetical protein